MNDSAHTDVAKLLSGNVLAKIFGLAATMLFARLLTKDQMAVFPAYLMLAGVPNLILTFGILSTFTREIPSLMRSDFQRARSMMLTGSIIIIAGTVLPSVAAYFLGEQIAFFAFRTTSLAWAVRIMVPGFMAYVVSKIVEYVMWSIGEFGATSKVQVVDSVVRPLMTLALYFVLGFKGVVIGLVIAQFATMSVGLYYIRHLFRGGWPSRYPVRQLISESMPYYIGNYISFLRGDGDTLLVATFLGPAALAEYYVAKNLYSNVILVQTSVDKVVLERLARFVRTPEFVDKVRQANAQISQLAIPFVLLAIAVAPNALRILAGPHYGEATWPAIFLLVSAMVQFVAIPIDRAVFLSLPGYLRVAYSICEATAVTTTAVVLIPVIGLSGMALARIIAPVGVYAFGLMLLWNRLKLSLSFDAAVMAMATALPGTVLVLAETPLGHGILPAIGLTLAGMAIWSVLFCSLTYAINRRAFFSARRVGVDYWHKLFPARAEA
ncbi:MAG TPA: oligosaccharide flippase family protein [Rhizomicrobium sp.]|nr:oligosaccharide flippase family protein [Rhizomicrobium sp.]